ncbi:hypothetical protein Dda_5440 [Drechslerella dactyloides]|uniref:Uncharacterized protein n=1 Tax=Drechslerella dactyloides TaxID=74499 RepID=A0AAD6IW70_DREDA|nr:hypothetical protein Dda_5440 [Drechslerella dactyloides]
MRPLPSFGFDKVGFKFIRSLQTIPTRKKRQADVNTEYTGANVDDDKTSGFVPETTVDRLARRLAGFGGGSKRDRSSDTLVSRGSRSSSMKRKEERMDRATEDAELISDDGQPRVLNDGDGDDPRAPAVNELAKVSKFSGIGVMIISLSIFSTLLSILFFMIAVLKPRYRNYIHATGNLAPTTASLLSAIFAKAIEISFVTVFTSFIGQALSKRALKKSSKGIAIADMLMKGWVYQPGSLLTTLPGLRYAGKTVLGAVCLFVVLCVTFYTTAADSLVSPKLRYGNWGDQSLRGIVSFTYANSTALASRCPAIISSALDGPMNGSDLPVSQSTCYKVHNSYQPLRDFTFYTDAWKNYRADASIPRAQLIRRPTGWTTVVNDRYYGAWLEVSDAEGATNVTLAMPHGGVVPSVRNVTLNDLVQPETQSDFGNIDVTASVVSPAINVLCYKLTDSTVRWFITNNASSNRNGTLDPHVQQIFNFDPDPSQTKSTAAPSRYLAPLFLAAPARFNIAIYASAGYDDPSMYALTTANTTSPTYSLCSLRSILTSRCSTNYVSANGGGNVTVDCTPDNPSALTRVLPSAKDTFQAQFKDISTELSYALSLNVQDAALSRILGIFATSTTPGFDPALPSVAEAFAILYSNAIVLSSVGAQFGTDELSNNYTGTAAYPITLPATETFRTRIRTVEYASGVSDGWQASFYVVLAGVMVLNLFCLVFFFVTRMMVFDVTDIENLFCVAYNSRPAYVGGKGRGRRRGESRGVEGEKEEEGFYGKGPRGRQFGTAFHVDVEDGKFLLHRRG